jgi:hypothetical protein
MRRFKEPKVTRYTGIYKGIAVEVADPNKLSRVRVRVKGIHDGIPDGSLPWASCHSPLPSSGGSGGAPKKGSKVSVRFLEGDLNYPVWSGAVFEAAADLPKNYKDGRFVLYESPDKSITIAVNEALGDIEIKTTNYNTTIGAVVDALLAHTHMTPAGASGNAGTGVPPSVAANFKTGELK